jgi:hypothetical protein
VTQPFTPSFYVVCVSQNTTSRSLRTSFHSNEETGQPVRASVQKPAIDVLSVSNGEEAQRLTHHQFRGVDLSKPSLMRCLIVSSSAVFAHRPNSIRDCVTIIANLVLCGSIWCEMGLAGCSGHQTYPPVTAALHGWTGNNTFSVVHLYGSMGSGELEKVERWSSHGLTKW